MITWQNGTEGTQEIETGEYVTINGVDYPVKTKIQSSTPLSAENLNENQSNLKDFLQLTNGNYTMADNELIDITAIANLNSILNNLNLTSYEVPTSLTPLYGNVSSTSLSLARNTDGSLAKIYGNIILTGGTPSSGYVANKVTFQTSLRPTSEFTILNAGIWRIVNNSGQHSIGTINLTVKTSGQVETSTFNIFSDTSSTIVILLPMLYWIKDFGDNPEE